MMYCLEKKHLYRGAKQEDVEIEGGVGAIN
eukprot:COSAG06_NODE_906_length_11624_cov_6.452321_10_plen_30_part_00